MLDPIKVSVVTPGMGRDGKLKATGIPAYLLAAYLDSQGIVVEKTTDFTSLFLFSMGVTRGKWGTLINALLGFHRDILANTPLERSIPALVAAHPQRYGKLGLGDLAGMMFGAVKTHKTTEFLSAAYGALPLPVLSPVGALRTPREQPRGIADTRSDGRAHRRHRRSSLSAWHSPAHAGGECRARHQVRFSAT